MEQILIDYIANATWQIPLLTGGAWLFIRLGKAGPRTQYSIWLAVLALAIGLPLRGVPSNIYSVAPTACTDCSMERTQIAGREALSRVASGTQLIAGNRRLSSEFFTLPRFTLRLSAVETNWIVGIYLAILLFSFYRIVAAWHRTRQMVMAAEPTAMRQQWNAIFQDCGRRLGARLPQLRTSADVRCPAIVGAVHPVLVLPKDFDNHTQNEVEATLFHELAHVRRHDYLTNLLCRVLALPVAWHPLMYGVQKRICWTREMICDDMAARAMRSEIGYAKCLLAMAASALEPQVLSDLAQSMGLFGDKALEERIMRLTNEKNTMTMRARTARIAVGATAMFVAIAMAGTFYVTSTLAQTPGTAVTVPTPPTPGLSALPQPPASVAPKPVEVPIAPAALEKNVAPVKPSPPVPPVAPAPSEAKPSRRGEKGVGHHPKRVDGEPSVSDRIGDQVLSTEQQVQLQKDLAAMDAEIAAATKQIKSPEFKRQLAEMARKQSEMKALNLAKMQRQIDAATARINSPEFKQKMENLQKQLENGAMRRSMEDASKQLKMAEEEQQNAIQNLDLSKLQKQIDEATAKINSPEFKQRMDKLQKQLESGAMQRSMEEANKRLKVAEDRMREAQTK